MSAQEVSGRFVGQGPVLGELLLRLAHQDIGAEKDRGLRGRRASCERAVPVRPGEAPSRAVGFPASTDPDGGRDAQSIAFFKTPGTP